MQEEVFLDPTYTLAHPNEATAKLALNENGELGFICSFQTVGDEIIFTGIGLANNKVWLGKTPLVIRASLDGAALQNAARIISSLTPDHTFNAPLGDISNTKSAKIPDSLFNLGSLGTLFKLLGQLQDAPDEEEPPTKNIGKPYFGQPEFNEDEQTTISFEFNMDNFLSAFDANGEEDDEELDFDTDKDDFLDDEPL
mgnify:CR=1 FL=1